MRVSSLMQRKLQFTFHHSQCESQEQCAFFSVSLGISCMCRLFIPQTLSLSPSLAHLASFRQGTLRLVPVVSCHFSKSSSCSCSNSRRNSIVSILSVRTYQENHENHSSESSFYSEWEEEDGERVCVAVLFFL